MHTWVPIRDDIRPQWRDMDDATRAQAYSPSSMVDGGIDRFIQAYADQSANAYADLHELHSLTYGPKPANTIDIALPKSGHPAPVHVFLHGGYWQQLGKRDSFFACTETIDHGFGFAAVDYTLAPHATLDDIVQECCTALKCLHENAASLGLDNSRIVLSGSSAGAHLAAMCCLRLPQALRPKGVVLVSGIYDLEPLLQTYINDAVGMDAEAAHRNSPAYGDLKSFPKTVIAWGGNETDEFKRQSQWFAHLLDHAGIEVSCLEMTARNHFDVVMDLANESALGQQLGQLANANARK